MGINLKLTVESFNYADHKNYITKKAGASNQYGCLIFLAFIFFLPVVTWATCTGSSPNWTSTADYNSVNTCVENASAGDTINISGNATWSSTLTINKSINLIGSGVGSTRITKSNYGISLITVSLSVDLPVRISNIYFDSVNNTSNPNAAIMASGKITFLRIDHCTFNKGTRTIYPAGNIYGVIDNNLFLNCNIAVGPVGDSNTSWIRPIEAGTANFLFIESNNFTLNQDAGWDINEQVYLWDGARAVIRYNTFDGETMTSWDSMCFDSHGNQNYYTGTGNDSRGQPITEIYYNIFKVYKTYRFLYIRGGSFIIHNNTFSTISGSAAAVAFSEEESWQTSFFSPLKTVWPAEDQVTNTFIWNNTLNGAPVTDATVWNSNDVTFIQKDRDYFMHAPQSSGGKSTYLTRAGGSNMTFTTSGPNAYYPYTPYMYPHPLRSLPAEIVPPKNLRLN
jgi:hypothetical protein